MTSLSQVITQLGNMGNNLVTSITPSLIAGAKLQALSTIIGNLGMIMLVVFLLSMGFVLVNKKEVLSKDPEYFWIKKLILKIVIGIFLVGFILYLYATYADIYGYFHPETYLAYIAIQSIANN